MAEYCIVLGQWPIFKKEDNRYYYMGWNNYITEANKVWGDDKEYEFFRALFYPPNSNVYNPISKAIRDNKNQKYLKEFLEDI